METPFHRFYCAWLQFLFYFGFREEKCTYTNCVSVGIVFDPALSEKIIVETLRQNDRIFTNVSQLIPLGSGHSKTSAANFTLAVFSYIHNSKLVIKYK